MSKAKRTDWSQVVTLARNEADRLAAEFGVRPSIRTVFYNLAGPGLPFPLTTPAYKYLDRLLVKARLKGEIPWGTFAEDRDREPTGGDRPFRTPEEEVNLALDYLQRSPDFYGLPRWEGQHHEVVLAVEKVGDAPIFESMTRNWSILVVPGKGYGAWESLRKTIQGLDSQRKLVVFYIGDFDPSGEDITRFTEQVFRFFGTSPIFKKLAVTKEQVETLQLPHRPEDATEIAKLRRDPRFRKWPWGLYRVETQAFLARATRFTRDLLDQEIEAYFDSTIAEANAPEEERLRLDIRRRVSELMDKLGR